jgi:hypothetical protein
VLFSLILEPGEKSKCRHRRPRRSPAVDCPTRHSRFRQSSLGCPAKLPCMGALMTAPFPSARPKLLSEWSSRR